MAKNLAIRDGWMVLIRLPQESHKALRIRAVESDTTIQD